MAVKSERLSTGLPPALALDGASAGDVATFCRRAVGFLLTGPAGRQLCVVAAAGFTSSPADCSKVAADCRSTLSDPQNAELQDAVDSCTSDLESGGCQATVEDLEYCLQENSDAIAASADSISCADAGNTTGLEGFEPPAPSARCETVFEACPGASSSVGMAGDDCCDPSDPCGFADDGFCDCSEQPWDAADCASAG